MTFHSPFDFNLCGDALASSVVLPAFVVMLITCIRLSVKNLNYKRIKKALRMGDMGDMGDSMFFQLFRKNNAQSQFQLRHFTLP